MRSRRSFAFWTLGLSVVLIASQAVGAEHREYAADAFDSAQRTGKSIIVVVRASWCPSCRVQELILSIIEYNPKYAGLVVFLVDFDAQKDALWQLDARAPSTLIAYKGDLETARSVGVTRLDSIAALLATTLPRTP